MFFAKRQIPFRCFFESDGERRILPASACLQALKNTILSCGKHRLCGIIYKAGLRLFPAARRERQKRSSETIMEVNLEKKPRIRTARHDKVVRKANTYFFAKVAFNLVLMALGAVLISLFLYQIQTQNAQAKQKESNELALEEAVSILTRNTENADTLAGVYHEGHWELLDNVERLLSDGMFEVIRSSEPAVQVEIFGQLSSGINAHYLFLLDPDGTVVFGDPQFVGINPAVTGHVTQDNLNRILAECIRVDGVVEPVLVRNQTGTYYFYSRSCVLGGKRYILAVGADSSALDEQAASLTDVAAVLSRMAITNDGFLFAVDRSDGVFQYYKNGDSYLTGQKAENVGINLKQLAGGYDGTLTILGKQYYCSSKTFGSSVIVAAAPTESVLSHNRYVVVWSVISLLVVMILCLVYAVIVRNDFVRKAVATDRVVLFSRSSNPVFFDKSVFFKVLPLMLLGILVVFGISFYLQTLLEIADGIDRSDAALQEVSGRYEESAGSRKIVEDYYDDRFLSTAKMLTFMVEEMPEILNEESDHYHSVVDEHGNRQYLADDEGNRLKSVPNSALLKQLCDENGIDSIYLFNENGQTIATNTPNWFFVLSEEEGDQSYPFRQVLDGKAESYAQSAMINDLGTMARYFGVTMHYYTKAGENGETVYVSRYEYEKAAAENGSREGTAGGITKHSSLLQIELDRDLAEQILAPTTAEYILSTNMLSGGAIVMFDAGSNNVCLYSPIQASIGKTAAELGISPKAFTGLDYYGFSHVNGVQYFQCYRYTGDYFIATAIPKAGMFPARFRTSLITAGVYLVLILILLLTVTVTSKEEETLYETMSREEAEKGLNSAIYSVILPSGRTASTVTAQARWDNRHIPWSERSPEQKLGLMIRVIIFVVLIYIALMAFGQVTVFRESAIIRYILSGAWDRGLNLFAVSACFLVLAVTVIAVELLRIPVRLSTALLGTRGETIGHLLLSVIRYGSVIVALFYCLYLLGVDSTSLLASAGIMSLVIGLGAQSLIKDIIAGIFIVFEGEFRVSDIVTINDFRGTVMDIGLRTTKVMALDGNIKIFNNSDITGVLNMTKETSMAFVEIGVEYGQDIDYVEAVLARELPELKKKNEFILEGPIYAGVTQLGDSGVMIGVWAKCLEQDIKTVTRFLNRELLQIFYRNEINVPFPNITLSQLDMTGRKTIQDLEQPKKENGEEEEAQK